MGWFRIDAGLQDKKLLLKPSQLYATFVSRGLISIVPCLSFIKTKEGSSLEKKFSISPSPQVVDRLKRKIGASSMKKPLLKVILRV